MGTITLQPHDCIKVCANIDSPGQVDLAVLLLPLASLASLIPLSALCELTPLSIPPDSNELAESADVDMTDSDVYVYVGTWYIPISAQLRMRIAQYVAQNARIMLCRFYAQNAPKNAGILCVSLVSTWTKAKIKPPKIPH